MIYTVNDINNLVKNQTEDTIRSVENNYHKKVSSLAETIVSDNNNKIIMISGPSASGKTTTANLLNFRLKSMGVQACVISLDDFYKNIDELPLDHNNKPDFESVYALNIKKIEECFVKLIKTGECDIPVFSFMNKKEKQDIRHIKIEKDGIAIVEGIHALNPLISQHLPNENLFKVYISVLDSVNDENQQIFDSRDLRLIRRLSRDYIYRNSSVINTLDMWEGVIKGEEKNLYPFSSEANAFLDTFHIYEPCLFKKQIFDLINLEAIRNPESSVLKRICCGLSKFVSIDEKLIPKESLIREFIKNY